MMASTPGGLGRRGETDIRSASGRVRAAPPVRPGGYWRLSCYDEDGRRIAQTTGGRTRERAAQRVAEEERRLTGAGLPGARASRGDDLLDFFLAETRPKFPRSPHRDQNWTATYAQQAASTVERYLRPVLGSVRLGGWSRSRAYEALDRCPTNYVVDKTRRTLSSVVTVGIENGFLRADQTGLHRVAVTLRADTRPSRGPTKAARRDQPLLVQPGEVPGVDQVRALAECSPAVPSRCQPWWSLWIYLLAYGGVREGELFATTAADVPGSGSALLTVDCQVEEAQGRPKHLTAPKNGLARLSAVCRTTPQGFPLWERLQERARVALEEQRRGINPRALIVPAPRGAWWSRSNFHARCFVPAAIDAGWPTLPWRGPVRRKREGRWVTETADRRDFRYTLHSLRHHYACTARDTWSWTVAELCANGGWSDPAFVMSRYYGLTPDVYITALAKQEGQAG